MEEAIIDETGIIELIIFSTHLFSSEDGDRRDSFDTWFVWLARGWFPKEARGGGGVGFSLIENADWPGKSFETGSR